MGINFWGGQVHSDLTTVTVRAQLTLRSHNRHFDNPNVVRTVGSCWHHHTWNPENSDYSPVLCLGATQGADPQQGSTQQTINPALHRTELDRA